MASKSTSKPVILPGMMDIYNQTMKLNQDNYNNMLQAFDSTGQGLAQNLPDIYQKYDTLNRDIFNTLGVGGGGWGVAAPAAQDIKDMFLKQNADIQQKMINSGLGNTSVGANLATQSAGQAARAYGALGADLAGRAAGFQAQTGLAGLQAQLQGQGMFLDLAKAKGGTLSGYRFGNQAGNLYGVESTSDSAEPTQVGGLGGGRSGGGGSSGGGVSPGGGGYSGAGYGGASLPAYGTMGIYSGGAGPSYVGATYETQGYGGGGYGEPSTTAEAVDDSFLNIDNPYVNW